uniref:50S ribosomal protein L5 (Mitochondrion) n=1 Tax=Botryococcus braunii Showa TaxID=1202541 RepID=A0A167RL50_BOTBR|nr:50S ribosomal protein L5 (mitochondrion) [Botryococcus braunii Showa]
MNRREEKNIIKNWFDIVIITLLEASSSKNVFTQFKTDPLFKLGAREGTLKGIASQKGGHSPRGYRPNPRGVRTSLCSATCTPCGLGVDGSSCYATLDTRTPCGLGGGAHPTLYCPNPQGVTGIADANSGDISHPNPEGLGGVPLLGIARSCGRQGLLWLTNQSLYRWPYLNLGGAAKAMGGVSLVTLTPNGAAKAAALAAPCGLSSSRGITGSALSGKDKKRVVHKKGKGGVTKTHYKNLFCSDFVIGFPIQNRLQIPCLERLVLHNTSKAAVIKKDGVLSPWAALSLLSGQRGKLLLSKKSVAAFKVRQGNLLGCKGDLRGDILFSFLDKFIFETLPREITTHTWRGAANADATATSFNHSPIPPEFTYGGVTPSYHQREQPALKLSNPDPVPAWVGDTPRGGAHPTLSGYQGVRIPGIAAPSKMPSLPLPTLTLTPLGVSGSSGLTVAPQSLLTPPLRVGWALPLGVPPTLARTPGPGSQGGITGSVSGEKGGGHSLGIRERFSFLELEGVYQFFERIKGFDLTLVFSIPYTQWKQPFYTSCFSPLEGKPVSTPPFSPKGLLRTGNTPSYHRRSSSERAHRWATAKDEGSNLDPQRKFQGLRSTSLLTDTPNPKVEGSSGLPQAILPWGWPPCPVPTLSFQGMKGGGGGQETSPFGGDTTQFLPQISSSATKTSPIPFYCRWTFFVYPSPALAARTPCGLKEYMKTPQSPPDSFQEYCPSYPVTLEIRSTFMEEKTAIPLLQNRFAKVQQKILLNSFQFISA